MGIKGLSKLVADICPEAIKELEMKSFFGRRIAVDASMSIYQFLIAIRSSNAMMTNESGETTSHLVGLFYRTCKLLEAGIKPVYVFDGKAPTLKGGELEKRRERQKEAKQKYDEAKEVAGAEEIAKFSRRLVRVTSQHNDDCKKLLKLMGIPIICAPSEAEAQCAQLCKEGLVYGIATEDMDGLTFGSPRVIRHLSAGHSDKVKEYTLEKVLEGLELTREQFVDLCILMGCDYCDSIKGIGGKKGLELIKQYGSIEEILEQKFGITEFIDPEIVYKDKIRPPEKIEKDDENGEPQLDQESEKVKKEKEEEEEEEEKEKDPDTNDEAEDEPRDEDEEKPALKSPKKEGGSNGHSAKRPKDDSDDENSSANESSGKEDSDGSGKKKKKKRAGPAVVVPEDWLFRGARKLFEEPNVLANVFTEKDLKIGDVDEDGMIEFLVKENGFSEDRVRSGIRRVRESKSKSAQSRIDSFFKVLPGKSPNKKPPSPAAKRGATSKGSASKRGRRPR